MKVTRYYAKGGDTSNIFKSIVVTNPALIVVSQTNPPAVGDVEITEIQYNGYQATIELDSKTYFDGIRSTHQGIVATATAKLLGLGLIQSEIDAMLT